MRILSVFNFITLNGFYKGPGNDISWHQHGGEEEGEFSKEGAGSGSTTLFGRVTYEMMASFWPTPEASKMFPEVAKSMNEGEKIVFSNSLKKADWNNTKIIGGDIVSEVKKLKESEGPDLTILGSGSIVSQFTDAGLIDVYQVMIDPLALGEGTSMFHGIKDKLELELTDLRKFKSGTVLLTYKPR